MMLARARKASVVASVVVALGMAWYILITPNNPLTRLFQREISAVGAHVIVGPYPVEKDIALFGSRDVGVIVSLLNPAIPYESVLLERERALAEKHGIRLLNFPMSSILGRKFGADYQQSAVGAAEAIAASEERVYLHCYLGMHRVQVVRDLLVERGVEAGTYELRSGERDEAALLLDAASAAYDAHRYQDALDAVSQIDESRLTDSARILRGWSLYRSGRIEDAREAFEDLVSLDAGNPQASIGLGYCAFRDADYVTAEREFAVALKALPDNTDALGGLGLTHYGAGRLAEAARHLEAALAISPDNQELRDVLARVPAEFRSEP